MRLPTVGTHYCAVRIKWTRTYCELCELLLPWALEAQAGPKDGVCMLALRAAGTKKFGAWPWPVGRAVVGGAAEGRVPGGWKDDAVG